MEKKRGNAGFIIGIVLLVLGVLSLLDNIGDFLNMDNWWPLILVGVGVVLIAAVIGNKSLAGLAVPGSILIMIGLILFVMTITGGWEAWSYCWALIIAASGIGTWISGVRSGRPELRKSGLDTIGFGLVLFALFAVIMEFIFTLSGDHRLVDPIVWAILLALLGFLLLVIRILRIGKPGSEKPDLFWPVLMIGAGLAAVFYLQNWMPADNLWKMLNLWPLLLIVLGVGILLRNRPWVGGVLGLLIVAGMLVVGIFGEGMSLPSQPDWISDIDIQIGNLEGELVNESGNQITQNQPISSVKRVELAIPASLEIIQGSVEELVVRGDESILAVLTTEVRSGKLTIRYEPGVQVRTSHLPKITLSIQDLSGLQVSSSGTVKMGSLNTSDFDLRLTSKGDISILGLQADEIDADLTSSGDIHLEGSANKIELDLSSSGDFMAGDLKVQQADINITSSGNVTLWVVDDLRAKISSSGTIYYYGNPAVHENLSSSGKLVSRGEK
jgi:hypothetical protein